MGTIAALFSGAILAMLKHDVAQCFEKDDVELNAALQATVLKIARIFVLAGEPRLMLTWDMIAF